MDALWFSGGKDSMACLLLNEHRLDDIHVLWANTGRYYPESLAFIEKAKAICPNWHEIQTDRMAQWEVNGLPSDLVPIDWTVFGQQFCALKPIRVQSYLQCCYENISGPLMAKSDALGVEKIIRGDRKDEAHTGVRSERFELPIWDWSADEVIEYLESRISIPEHFNLEHSSMDCYDCTAFAAHSKDRIAYMKDRHPEKYAEHRRYLTALCDAINEPLAAYRSLYG